MIKFTPLETLQGIFTFIFVLISIILGLIIIIKYFQYKRRKLFLVGLTWIGVASPYLSDAISFIMILLIGMQLDYSIYIFITLFFIPLTLIVWIVVFADLILRSLKQKVILISIVIIQEAIFELIFLYLYFINLALIGERITPFYVEYTEFIIVYFLIPMLIFVISGIIFAINALKSNIKEIQLKGKFLILAFVNFAIGTFIEVIFEFTEITIVLARVFLIISAFSFYIGFTMPEFIKNYL